MNQQHKSIYYPPGGILIWFLIILEIFTFFGGIMVFLNYRTEELTLFQEAQQQLNPLIGTINTIVLIISGFFIANSIHFIKNSENKKAARSILISLLLGVTFLIIKSAEYYAKMEQGIGFSDNTFFTFYWMMTGFHFIHVLFGIGLLSYMYIGINKNTYHSKNYFDIESSATYWHLCDLIWILIFPIFYLI